VWKREVGYWKVGLALAGGVSSRITRMRSVVSR
jgi:hypothetical protein